MLITKAIFFLCSVGGYQLKLVPLTRAAILGTEHLILEWDTLQGPRVFQQCCKGQDSFKQKPCGSSFLRSAEALGEEKKSCLCLHAVGNQTPKNGPIVKMEIAI